MGYRFRGRRSSRYDSWGRYPEYVPVGVRRAQAEASCKELEKERGRKLSPVKTEGTTIARTFWGKGWCQNLEAYSDYSNRLPRGRTYVRNGSVIDLEITKRTITALVSGSSLYEVEISIDALAPSAWTSIQRDCSRSIASLIDLLQARFDRGVMERLTKKDMGLFPRPKEIRMSCSCPDSARMCKHIAAVLYGVGARLDQSPELLFTLRDVDHLDLIGQAASAENLDQALMSSSSSGLDAEDLGAMFGIELESTTVAAEEVRPVSKRRPKKAASATTKPPRKTSANALTASKAVAGKPKKAAKKTKRKPARTVASATRKVSKPATTAQSAKKKGRPSGQSR